MKIKKNIQRLFFSALILSGLSSSLQAAAISSPAEAVIVAAEQRTLTQVMLNSYILSGLGVRSRKANQILADAIDEFAQHQQQLKIYLTDAALLQQLAVMEQSWRTLHEYYLDKPDRGHFQALYNASENLLSESNNLLEALSTQSPGGALPLLNRVGQQAVLCQRLSVLYGMMAWGINQNTEDQYNANYDQLRSQIVALQALPQNTPEITRELRQLEKLLERTRVASDASTEAFVPGLIDRSVVKMMQHVELLQTGYLRLSTGKAS